MASRDLSPNADAATAQEPLPLTVEAATTARHAASAALSDTQQAYWAAEKAWRAEWNPKLEAAKAAMRAADADLRLAASAVTPDHEWDGKRVVRDMKRRGWGNGTERQEGVVFTYRPGCDLGPGHSYSRPEIGTPFVRLLKKDGKPGAKTVSLTDRRGAWSLAEPAETQTVSDGAGYGTASGSGAQSEVPGGHQ